MSEIVKTYAGTEVVFKEINGETMVRIDEVAKFCGWAYKRSGRGDKEFIRWNTVNKYLDELGVSQEVATGDYIPEYIMYPLIGKAKNEQATKFMLWVGQVIAEIRKNGMYISDTATDSQKRFNYKMIDVTFRDCPLEKLPDTYKKCMEFHKQNKTRLSYAPNSKRRSDAHHTQSDSMIMIMNKIEKTLDKRRQDLLKPETVDLCLTIDDVLKAIKEDIGKQKQRSSRSKIGNQTKAINERDKQIQKVKDSAVKFYDETRGTIVKLVNYYESEITEFEELPIHPFSVNYVTDPVYQQWKQAFPRDQVAVSDDIDFSKPVDIWLRFDMEPKLDVSNMMKTTIDMLSSALGVDDKLFQPRECSINQYVSSYSQGKIYYIIRQAQSNIA